MIDVKAVRGAYARVGSGARQPGDTTLRDSALDVLLASPRVWWCEWQRTVDQGCLLPEFGPHDDCGWRLLVPVKGEA